MKILCIAIGCLCLVAGTIGIVLPILPTTPLYLAATFCFTKGSKRVHRWFIRTSLYKRYLESFVTERAMTVKTKLRMTSLASGMIIFSMIMVDKLYLRIFLLFCIAFIYYYFIFRIKTKSHS